MSSRSFIPANTNQVKNLLSTGVVKGGGVTIANIGGGTADVTIEESLLRYVDNFTDPKLPNFIGDKLLSETTTLGVDITVTRKIIIDSDLNVTFPVFTGIDGPEDRRVRVELGILAANAGAFIPTYSSLAYDVNALLRDSTEAYGIVRILGNKLEPNTNLSFKRTAGRDFVPTAVNFQDNIKDPLNDVTTEVDPVTFFTSWQDGSGGFNRSFGNTLLDPTVYDDGAGGVSAPSGVVSTNQAQIFRVYEIGGSFGVSHGQTRYINIAAALDAIFTEQEVLFGNFIGTGLRGFIVVRGGATNLTLPADALIFDPQTDFVTVRG